MTNSIEDGSIRLLLDGLSVPDMQSLHLLIEAAKEWYADWLMLDDGDSPYLEAERTLARAVEGVMKR